MNRFIKLNDNESYLIDLNTVSSCCATEREHFVKGAPIEKAWWKWPLFITVVGFEIGAIHKEYRLQISFKNKTEHYLEYNDRDEMIRDHKRLGAIKLCE